MRILIAPQPLELTQSHERKRGVVKVHAAIAVCPHHVEDMPPA